MAGRSVSHPAIIEAAAQALEDCWNNNRATGAEPFPLSTGEALQAILTAVTPLIEAATLERAAKVAEEQTYYPDTNIGMRQQWVKDQIATKIRALKEQP